MYLYVRRLDFFPTPTLAKYSDVVPFIVMVKVNTLPRLAKEHSEKEIAKLQGSQSMLLDCRAATQFPE